MLDRKAKIILALALFLLSLPKAEAQFYLPGDDPGGLKWSQIRTDSYKLIYPAGMDSLAREYALALESCKLAVGTTCGYVPNQNYRRPMPVLLHPYSVYSNGSVAWAPRQMQLITTPQATGTLPQPWLEQLAVHETRHVAQMQFCNYRGFKVPSIIFGQLWAGAISAVYPGRIFFEGDAVAAETELSLSGRGRNGDFLEYYRVSFARGQRRDYWKWCYGSQKVYTPDYYRIGYIMNAGMRDVYDCPDFTARYFNRIFQKGLPFWNYQKTVKEVSGCAKFKDAYNVICDTLESRWQRERDQRGPFVTAQQHSPDAARYVSHGGLAAIGDDIYSIRTGIASSPTLVRTDRAGVETDVIKFAPTTSGLRASGEALYWVESLPDLRWGMRSYSDLRRLDADGRVTTLTHGQRFFNPCPSPDGRFVSVTEFPAAGGSAIVVLDATDAHVVSRVASPSDLQLMETVWLGSEMYVTAICDHGWGIYRVRGEEFTTVLAPAFYSISKPFAHDGNLYFRSDRDGVGELYRLSSQGELYRVTNTEFGSADYQFVGDSLYYTKPDVDGRYIYVSSVDSLRERHFAAYQGHSDSMAEKLTVQNLFPPRVDSVGISEPRPYSKAGNLMRFHSWAPAYVNVDYIDQITSNSQYQVAGLGATAFFQNDLGTMYGSAGFHINPGNMERCGGYAKFTYSGLYPVMEFYVDGNNRESVEYYPDKAVYSGHGSIIGQFRTYVPLNFSSGGWRRGLIPQLGFAVSNDQISLDGQSFVARMQLSASVRGYIMQFQPSSCMYPRWGIGAETGYTRLLGISDYKAQNAYGYVYGYVPGIFPTHGIKLAAYSSCTRAYVSLDYALPFAPVDWSVLCPVAYIRNFEIVPHVEYNWYYGITIAGLDSGSSTLAPFRWGADVIIRFSNLLWIPFDTRLGVRARNTGASLIFGINF